MITAVATGTGDAPAAAVVGLCEVAMLPHPRGYDGDDDVQGDDYDDNLWGSRSTKASLAPKIFNLLTCPSARRRGLATRLL